MSLITNGYYVITHRKSGRFYAAASKALTRRIINHRNELQRGVHHNEVLQKLFVNWDDFHVEIHPTDTYAEAEQKADNLRFGIKTQALCMNKGTREFSDEERIRVSKAMSARPLSAYEGKPVIAGGRSFHSIYAASNALGMNRQTVRNRLVSTSQKFTDWHWA